MPLASAKPRCCPSHCRQQLSSTQVLGIIELHCQCMHSHDVNTKYDPNAKINMLHLNLNVNQQWSSMLAGPHLINTCDACVHFAADVETKLRVK